MKSAGTPTAAPVSDLRKNDLRAGRGARRDPPGRSASLAVAHPRELSHSAGIAIVGASSSPLVTSCQSNAGRVGPDRDPWHRRPPGRTAPDTAAQRSMNPAREVRSSQSLSDYEWCRIPRRLHLSARLGKTPQCLAFASWCASIGTTCKIGKVSFGEVVPYPERDPVSAPGPGYEKPIEPATRTPAPLAMHAARPLAAAYVISPAPSTPGRPYQYEGLTWETTAPMGHASGGIRPGLARPPAATTIGVLGGAKHECFTDRHGEAVHPLAEVRDGLPPEFRGYLSDLGPDGCDIEPFVVGRHRPDTPILREAIIPPSVSGSIENPRASSRREISRSTRGRFAMGRGPLPHPRPGPRRLPRGRGSPGPPSRHAARIDPGGGHSRSPGHPRRKARSRVV